jgi:hypothetical protein
VGGAHPGLEGPERVFDGLPAHAHSVSRVRASRRSSLVTTSSRFASDLKLSIGLAVGTASAATLSPSNSVWLRFFGILPGQLRVSQPPSGN